MSDLLHPGPGWMKRGRRAMTVLLGLVVAEPALAQAGWAPPRPEPGTYEAWRDRGGRPYTGIIPWRHDPEFLALFRPWLEQWWARFAGLTDVDHPSMWAFIQLGDGIGGDEYEARWVAECMAAGDIVIPYLSAPVDPDNLYQRGPDDGRRYVAFAIFAFPAPPEGVEPVLRTNLAARLLTPAEIDAVVATYRAMYVFD